jgi:hypothetical protein
LGSQVTLGRETVTRAELPGQDLLLELQDDLLVKPGLENVSP